jgi:ABC-type lipoprotein release transport system permease subunit
LLGFLLNPVFTQFSTSLLDFQLISPYTIVLTVIFGALIAFLSTYSSAKKASRLNTVHALREYLPTEDAKNYKKRSAWLALILGSYKIIVFALGINMSLLLTQTIFRSGGNFVLGLLAGLWMFVDLILTFIGPLLFFWGFTKIFIQGSLKFQAATTKIATFLGDLGTLATKNVRRNPARSAAVAFLIALIIGYAAQVTVQLASENDYAVRNIYYQIGADVSVAANSANTVQTIYDGVINSVGASIENATIEYTATSGFNVGGYSMTVKALQPTTWPKTAYYENEWFSGADISTAFNEMVNDKNTILLDRSAAQYLNVQVGDNLAISTHIVRIVGFYGLPKTDSIIAVPYQYQQYISIIPEQLLTDLNPSSRSARILLKLKQGANGETVANTIRALDLDTAQITSFAEQYKQAQSNVIIYGATDAQRLGMVFAVLAASVGTGLVSAISMKERSREAAMMSVKGLSYKQLLIMFLTENLAVVLFSTILGLIVGLIAAYGSISSGNILFASVSFGSLIQRRFVLPPDSALFLVGCLALIFASTIIPITIMARKYVTNLERMVRIR